MQTITAAASAVVTKTAAAFRPASATVADRIEQEESAAEKAEQEADAFRRTANGLKAERSLSPGDHALDGQIVGAEQGEAKFRDRAKQHRDTAEGLRIRLADERERERLAELAEWRVDLAAADARVADLIADVEERADGLAAAASAMIEAIVAATMTARRATGVADQSGLMALRAGLNDAVLARLSIKSAGVFPAMDPTERWRREQRPTLTAAWSTVLHDLEQSAADYNGPLQPK